MVTSPMPLKNPANITQASSTKDGCGVRDTLAKHMAESAANSGNFGKPKMATMAP